MYFFNKVIDIQLQKLSALAEKGYSVGIFMQQDMEQINEILLSVLNSVRNYHDENLDISALNEPDLEAAQDYFRRKVMPVIDAYVQWVDDITYLPKHTEVKKSFVDCDFNDVEQYFQRVEGGANCNNASILNFIFFSQNIVNELNEIGIELGVLPQKPGQQTWEEYCSAWTDADQTASISRFRP